MNASVTPARMGRTLIITAALVAITGCGQPATPSSSTALASDRVAATALPTVNGSPDRPAPSSAPPAQQTTRPSPSPRPRLAKWSTTPHRIFKHLCESINTTVDTAGLFHVAAGCWPNIRYASSTDGKAWTTSTFAAPTDRFDVDPQLTVDRTTLYLAYTRLRPIEPDTCGGRFPPENVVGMFYRTRTLPDGRWSAPTQFGRDGDHLQSVRVIDGVIHATSRAVDGTGAVHYGFLKGARYREIPLPGAEATSLRIGDDGRPRIAFTTAHSLRYAVVTGDRIATTEVFSAKDVIMESPVLVLGRGDHAFVSWAAVAGGEGCEGPVPVHEGTWFATDADGTWAVKRLSRDIGAASLALDVDAGRLHATYNDQRGIRYVTRAADGTWSGSRLETPSDFSGSVLRRDPSNGMLLLVGRISGEDESAWGMYAVTAS